MARIIGFTYGELRGKIGGTVYSRNKSGAYARARVTPVNPQTVRQQTARYSFGNNSILYQNLSAALKDCWEVFARTHFNPLKGNSTGIYSGGNAFVALRSSVNQGNSYKGVISGIQGANSYDFTSSTYTEITDPPSAPTSSTIICSDGVARVFNITEISVFSNGQVEAGLIFPSAETGDTQTYNSFVNAEGQNFGIGFYMSNNLKFPGAKPNTSLKLNFADSGVITEIEKTTGTGAPRIDNALTITLQSPIVKSEIRDFPCEGDHILVTPFIRTQSGAQKLMAPQYVTVQA